MRGWDVGIFAVLVFLLVRTDSEQGTKEVWNQTPESVSRGVLDTWISLFEK